MPRIPPRYRREFDAWVAQLRDEGHAVTVIQKPKRGYLEDVVICVLNISGKISSYQWDKGEKKWN